MASNDGGITRSSLPVGASLVGHHVARYIQPSVKTNLPRSGGSGTALPPPTSYLSVPSPPVGATLVVARYMRPCITNLLPVGATLVVQPGYIPLPSPIPPHLNRFRPKPPP